MAKSKSRIRFPSVILVLCALILVIFVIDFLWRNVFSPVVPGDTESAIVVEGTFAADNSAEETLETETEASTEAEETEESEEATDATQEDPTVETITLSQSQIHNGPLILVSSTCPFIGDTNFIDFTTNTNSNVLPRDVSLQYQPEMQQALSDLFDGYCNDNGYVNLQIYSTSEINTASDSLYTTVLSERSTGYTFDIGLITSTGDVVAYLTKRNEWMFSNCWNYGFIVRYPDTKTGTTGVGFMPHHFRYVGLPHSLIMNEQDMCLEEYLTYLTSYTMETGPLTYTVGDQTYEIYYVPAEESGNTTVTLPKGSQYTVSGNNTDGFILTVQKSTSAAMAEEATGAEAGAEAATDATEASDLGNTTE